MGCSCLFELVLGFAFEVMTSPAELWRMTESGQMGSREMSTLAVSEVGDDGGLPLGDRKNCGEAGNLELLN